LSINIVVDRVALRKLKGYRGILHIMGEELRVSDKEIDMLKARQLRGEFDDLGRDNEIRFRIGEKVIIDEGPFRGNYAVLRAFPGKAFMMAEVELLSYQNRVVKLPLSFLR
jgi:transcription antitermination factor NusG